MKVRINGKEYSVETLLYEIERLKRKVRIESELRKNEKILMLECLKYEIEGMDVEGIMRKIDEYIKNVDGV